MCVKYFWWFGSNMSRRAVAVKGSFKPFLTFRNASYNNITTDADFKKQN